MKVRDLMRLIESDGWQHVRTRGSHRQYKHPVKKGRVTVPGHTGDDGGIIRIIPVAVQFIKIREYALNVIQGVGAQGVTRHL